MVIYRCGISSTTRQRKGFPASNIATKYHNKLKLIITREVKIAELTEKRS